MATPVTCDHLDTALPAAARAAGLYPRRFGTVTEPSDAYLNEPAIRILLEFFEKKGLPALKQEDQRGQWYADWLEHQAKHGIYASVLSPKAYSPLGLEFDLLRYSRFLEVFAYCSPAHGYSMQVTFLGLFSILMGSNPDLKREAVAALQSGAVFAIGVSERKHGSDLLANDFTLREIETGRFMASGTKYYIGNSNVASMISILGRKDEPASPRRSRRARPVLFALRPQESHGFKSLRKIRTLGIRAAYVGEFQVQDQPLPVGDIIAEGRDAWDAVIGTVTLGKFFLGFGSIGMCEHALQEALDHLRGRILYGKSVMEMPHIRAMMTQAYARLTAMKLYAYRALDYVHAASAEDRRYLLFCAVQKAKVSTEGVRVMAKLSECVGAKGFEADTYIEMALRDIQLIPGLEGSTHINLVHTAQFLPRYFTRFDQDLVDPRSMVGGEDQCCENQYLMQARSNEINTIGFPSFLQAYIPLKHIVNVRRFVKQIRAFALFLRISRGRRGAGADTELSLAFGDCLATISYGQLIAENSQRLKIGEELVGGMFHLLVQDLTAAALLLASLPQLDAARRLLLSRMTVIPRTTQAQWDVVSVRMNQT